MKSHDGLDLERVHRHALGRSVCKGDGILNDESDQQPSDAFVNQAKGGASLPRALPSALGCRSWEDKCRPYAYQPTGFALRPRHYRDIEQLHIAELGAASASRTRDCNHGEGRPDQLDEREKSEVGDARDDRSYDHLVGLNVRPIVGRRVTIANEQLRQSSKRVGKILFELLFRGQRWWRLSVGGSYGSGCQPQTREHRPHANASD